MASYDIRNIGYEFIQAEACIQKKDYKNALYHYRQVVKNYEFSDNEYLISPTCEYTVIENGKECKYPSILSMVGKAEIMINQLKNR